MVNSQLYTDAMNMPKTNLPNILELKKRFSQFSFEKHEIFHWSPRTNTVYYNTEELNSEAGIFQLLHEVSHALCGHTSYTSGIQLVKIEAEAWQKAKELAQDYGLKIPQKQIERCLDSYRDWLHLRSTCPECGTIALETASNHYKCFNCLQKWSVPVNQRSRKYRLKLES